MKKFGRLNWTILIIFGLIGQIAWSVENMYFNVFVFDTIAKDLDTILNKYETNIFKKTKDEEF